MQVEKVAQGRIIRGIICINHSDIFPRGPDFPYRNSQGIGDHEELGYVVSFENCAACKKCQRSARARFELTQTQVRVPTRGVST